MHPLTLLLVLLSVTLVAGVPISFALILSSAAVVWAADLPLTVVVQQMFVGINSFTLLALPFFFLAGNVMTHGGISERLVKLAMALVGHLRGGLAHVNVVVGMFISGISGSSTADAAAISSIFAPAMKKRGYDERFSVCLSACTSTMGAVIPPSILMVVYGATANTSIGALLIGGIVPGILMGLALMVQSHVFAVKYDFPREHPRFLGLRAVWAGVKASVWPLGVPVIIIVGMVGGVFTPTESAAVAAVYALFITLFVFKSLSWRALPKIFGETAVQFSQVLFCLGGATIFGWLLAFYQVPDIVTDFIVSFTRDPIVVMVLIVFVNVLLGTFMDALPAILIFVPIIHPLAVEVGIHPVHLGVIVVMTQSFGLLTPPLGMCAMTACAVAGVSMARIQKLLHIMMLPLLLVIMLCALAPWTALALPRVLVPNWL
ncbi:TRAP transporter large permease [Piscinibacter sp.]|uniref:TRAP transporter large permease n=1 Tax=Piscinibacter sp. TaxID=1903157 RepID=UPI002CA56662|nr:TRAP transporter large permease [Albitalea sp.]HUG22511.1 TRAP transporter large permease [Albitalea sp.]